MNVMELAMKDMEQLIGLAQTNTKTAYAVYNAKGYGAVGDGITDDTSAIQSLIDTVNSAGGGVIYFPPGTYLLSTTPNDSNSHLYLYNTAKIMFIGSGDSTVLKANSTNKDLIRVSGGSADITIKDMTLDRISGAVAGGNGIHFYNWYANPRWNGDNVTITNQYNGIYADSARPQGSMWVACRFRYNTNNGVELVMNNDEYFNSCVFEYNTNHGIKIGDPASTVPSDGAVYLDNCLFYNNKDGIHAEGNATNININIFIDGGIIDNNSQYGIYMTNSQTVQIATTITFSGKKGVYLGTGCREVRLSDVKSSDSSEEGFYIDSGAKFISASGLQAMSNGRSAVGNFYGIKIVGTVSYVNFMGGISGNGDDTNVTRNTQDGGIYIDATGGTPDLITILGFQFPGMSNTVVMNGSVGVQIQVIDTQGPGIGIRSGEYLSFAGAGGAQRMRYNPGSNNLEFEWNMGMAGTNGGSWNGPHFLMGSYHLWVDALGRLRIKSGSPASDTDGTVIGAQT